jgi:hypothetical protein
MNKSRKIVPILVGTVVLVGFILVVGISLVNKIFRTRNPNHPKVQWCHCLHGITIGDRCFPGRWECEGVYF